MPIYEYHCRVCGRSQDLLLRLAQLDERQYCGCGSGMDRQISAPAIHGDYPGYVSPASGQWVEGRAAHLEDLKRTNCRIYEPGETDAYIKGKAAREKAFGDAVEAVVEKATQDMGMG